MRVQFLCDMKSYGKRIDTESLLAWCDCTSCNTPSHSRGQRNKTVRNGQGVADQNF